MNKENDVILAILKLSRAMRRCAPPPSGRPAPDGPSPERPGRPMGGSVGRLLACVAENPRVSSRDLCEARAERENWIIRTVDEEDRRIQRVDLSPKGQAFIAEMEAARERDAARKTACFTEEEKAQFCALCNRLSEHLESLSLDLPERPLRPDRPPRKPFLPEGRMRC